MCPRESGREKSQKRNPESLDLIDAEAEIGLQHGGSFQHGFVNAVLIADELHDCAAEFLPILNVCHG